MEFAQAAFLVAGALAGGIVNGLTGFGTAITALGIWVYAIPPTDASSLSIICSTVSQTQNLHLIWRSIEWKRVLFFVIPGLFGVPLGTFLLPHIDPRLFKLGLGGFLLVYPAYVLARTRQTESAWGGKTADGAVGFISGILGGFTGLSGVLPVVWTDIRGWSKEQRRSVVQFFNMAILSLALVSHAASGLLTRQVGIEVLIVLPATIGGSWLGALVYRRLADRGYQRIVMVLLLISGATLVWTAW
jgi:uncharacterized membrane protein YfcA